VDSGAHRRTSAGGDDGRYGAARCCARANAREEEGVGRRAGLLARMHASWLGAWPVTAAEWRGSASGSARGVRVRVAVGPSIMADAWSTP
jgi:hypothetical protein